MAEKLKVDSSGVKLPPITEIIGAPYQLRRQQFANARNNMVQFKANAAMQDVANRAQTEKAVKNYHKQPSDQTRKVTYSNPIVQQEQDRKNLTPEQEMRRDQPQHKPNMDMENGECNQRDNSLYDSLCR